MYLKHFKKMYDKIKYFYFSSIIESLITSVTFIYLNYINAQYTFTFSRNKKRRILYNILIIRIQIQKYRLRCVTFSKIELKKKIDSQQ